MKECISLKEPVKKPKPKGKKKDGSVVTEPDPPENSIVVTIRSLSVKLLYYLIYPLRVLGAVSTVSDLLRASNDMTSAVCNNILFSIQAFQQTEATIEVKVSKMQDLVYGLQVLAFLTRNNSLSCEIVARHEISQYLPFLLQTKQVAFYALQVMRSLSMTEECIGLVSSLSSITLMLNLTDIVTQKLKDLTVVVEIPTGKGKDAKKDDKSKKGQPIVAPTEESDPFDTLDVVKLDPKRECVVWLTLFSYTFIEIVKRNPGVFDSFFVDRTFAIVNGFLLNEGVWEICRQELAHPLDEPVDRLLEFALSLLGSLSEISYEIRLQLSRGGAMTLFLSFLLNSKKIYPHTQELAEPSLPRKQLLSVRRFAEKAAFSLLLSEEVRSLSDFTLNTQECRWFANYQYAVTEETFTALGQNLMTLFSDLITNVEDFDLANRSVRILSTISYALKLSNRTDLLTQGQTDRGLTTKISALAQALGVAVKSSLELKAEMNDRTEVEGTFHNLDPSLTEGLYLTLGVLEIFTSMGSDHVKITAEKPRIELFSRLIDILGPTLNGVVTEETQAHIYNPREYNWELQPKSVSNCERYLLRPVIIDLLTHIISSDEKYRTFEGTLPAEAGKPQPATACVTEEAVFNSIKLVADVILKIFLKSITWEVCEDDVVRLTLNRGEILDDEIRISSLQYLCAVGKCGPIGLAGILDSVADAVFSANSGESSLSSLFQAVPLVGGDGVVMNPTQVSWKRPVLWSDAFASPNVCSLHISKISLLSTNTVIWPFIAVSAALQSVMMDPLASTQCGILSLEASRYLMQSTSFHDYNQPVIIDLLIAAFLSFGGGLSAVGLIGSFGHIKEEEKQNFSSFLGYILSRGKTRQLFWKNYYEVNKEPVNIDPKTGKPIPKKEDKKKDTKEPKKDPKAPVIVPIISEIVYPTESTEEFNDPNRGPTIQLWKELLDFKSANAFLHTKKSTVLINAIQSSLFDLASLLMDQDVNINTQDEHGRSALMYALLLEDSMTVEKLLNYRNLINVNLADALGNGTIFYALCSFRNNINQVNTRELFKGYCLNPFIYDFNPIPLYGNANLLPLLLQYSASYHKEYRLNLTVISQHGFPLLLFALGIGSLRVELGGYVIEVMYEAYFDSTYALVQKNTAFPSPQRPNFAIQSELRAGVKSTVESLLLAGAIVNQSSPSGLVPLHIALAYGDQPLLELFFAHLAEANVVDFHGRHGLHYLFASCPPSFDSVYQYFMEKCLFRPITQIRHIANQHLTSNNSNDDPVSSDYHRQKDDSLNTYFQESLSTIFPTTSSDPLSVSLPCPEKRIERFEFLFFCKEFLFGLTPLDYCFLHEYYVRVQAGNSFSEKLFAEIIRFNQLFRHKSLEEAKSHRVQAILTVLYEMKIEDPFPLIMESFPILRLDLSDPSSSFLYPEEEEFRTQFWLLRQAKRLISDNNDIKRTINGYNIQNNLNLLFFPLHHCNLETSTSDTIKIPLQEQSIIAAPDLIRISLSKSMKDVSFNILHMLALVLWKGKGNPHGGGSLDANKFKRNIQYRSLDLQLMDIVFILVTMNHFYYQSSDNDFLFISAATTFPLPELNEKPWTSIHLAILADNVDLLTMLYQQSFAIPDIVQRNRLITQQPLDFLADAPNLAISSPYSSLQTFDCSVIPTTPSLTSPKIPTSSSPGKRTKKKKAVVTWDNSGSISASSARVVRFWTDLQLIHYIAHTPAQNSQFNYLISKEICSLIVSIYQQDPYREDWKQLFNEASSSPFDWAITGVSVNKGPYVPFHRAIITGQIYLLEALSECRLVDVNRKDPATGYTPLHLLVIHLCERYAEDVETMQRYFNAISAAKDRIDLTILAKCPLNDTNSIGEIVNQDHEGETIASATKFMTCIEYVIVHRHKCLLQFLLELRKNDVIEIVLNTNGRTSSLLFQLEEENDQLLRQLALIEIVKEETKESEYFPAENVVDEIVREEEQDEDHAEEELLDQGVESENENNLIERDLVVAPEIVQEQGGQVTILSEEERLELIRRLEANQSVLKVLLEVINPLNLLDSSAHFHERYFKQELVAPPSLL